MIFFKKGENRELVLAPSPTTPYTLLPAPYTLQPTTYTLHPATYNLHPTLYILHPTPYTLHPTPYTQPPCISFRESLNGQLHIKPRRIVRVLLPNKSTGVPRSSETARP